MSPRFVCRIVALSGKSATPNSALREFLTSSLLRFKPFSKQRVNELGELASLAGLHPFPDELRRHGREGFGRDVRRRLRVRE